MLIAVKYRRKKKLRIVIVIFIKTVYTKRVYIPGRIDKGGAEMKLARFVLKIVAASLAAAALTCCIIAYWDRIAEAFGCARDRLAERRCASEYDDYADWVD